MRRFRLDWSAEAARIATMSRGCRKCDGRRPCSSLASFRDGTQPSSICGERARLCRQSKNPEAL